MAEHGEDPIFPPAAAFSEKAHVKSMDEYKVCSFVWVWGCERAE